MNFKRILILAGSLTLQIQANALTFDTAHLLNFNISSVQAEETTKIESSKARDLEIHNKQQQAKDWQLTHTEWQRYKTLMQGAAGRWYAKLDPPEVLGLLARNEAERNHYATLVVNQRKARIDRELAFNRAVHQAWLREYPHLKPIHAFDTSAFRVVKSKHQ